MKKKPLTVDQLSLDFKNQRWPRLEYQQQQPQGADVAVDLNNHTVACCECICGTNSDNFKKKIISSAEDSRRTHSLHSIELHGSLDRILSRRTKQTLYGTITSRMSLTFTVDSKKNNAKRNPDAEIPVSVSDIIGGFGWFQLMVLIFSGLREGTVGYDAVVMSIIMQPNANFSCADKIQSGYKISPITQDSLGSRSSGDMSRFGLNNETFQCFRSLNGYTLLEPETSQPLACESWLFPDHSVTPSLVSEWSLVCQYHWLVAFIQSAYFFGLVSGNFTWGFTADKIGRRKAYLISHTISLVSGMLSLLAPNIWLFCLCRFFCAFGSIGYNIIYSIQVELIGTKHRAFSTTLNHLGWGTGVIMVPIVDHLFSDYRPIISVAPMLTLIMYPWAFWLPESSRWLMANERYHEARRELLRAAKFNGKTIGPEIEKSLSSLEARIRYDKMLQETLSSHSDTSSVGFAMVKKLIFDNPILLRDTIVLAFTCLSGHLFYYLLTINFGYVKNLSTDANFIVSGAGEWVSVVTGAVLLRIFSRKTCMSICLFLMISSFAFQSLIDSELTPSLDTQLVITLNNAIGTLSSLLLIFITLIVNQEIFPTVIRQTGSSMVNTFGEFGSTLAPLVLQFGLLIGPWRADLLFAATCFISFIGIQFITPTDDIELSDT